MKTSVCAPIQHLAKNTMAFRRLRTLLRITLYLSLQLSVSESRSRGWESSDMTYSITIPLSWHHSFAGQAVSWAWLQCKYSGPDWNISKLCLCISQICKVIIIIIIIVVTILLLLSSGSSTASSVKLFSTQWMFHGRWSRVTERTIAATKLVYKINPQSRWRKIERRKSPPHHMNYDRSKLDDVSTNFATTPPPYTLNTYTHTHTHFLSPLPQILTTHTQP